MIVIKTNYNNAYVKKPVCPTPSLLILNDIKTNDDESISKRLLILVHDNLNTQQFFTNCRIYIHINDILVASFDKRSNHIAFVNYSDFDNAINPQVVISGYYFNDNGYQMNFKTISKTIFYKLVCSNDVRCSNNLHVKQTYSAYLNPEDNLFYDDDEFTNEIELHEDRIILDELTNGLYKWNNQQECYILI